MKKEVRIFPLLGANILTLVIVLDYIRLIKIDTH